MMLPNKIGPMKKLALLVDGLKAKHLSKTLDEQSVVDCAPFETTESHKDTDTAIELENSFASSEKNLGEPGPSCSTPVRDMASPAPNIKSGDITKFIPTYSSSIQSLLRNGEITKDWDKFIEETAYHILSFKDTDFNTRDLYGDLGRELYSKYPCIGFNAGSQPWTHFTSRLSQKIRNIRWRWNKKGKKSLEGDGPPSKIMKKGPRRFELDPGSTDEILSLEQETDVILSMQEEMKKTKTERNKALLLRHQRETFVGRRKYLNTIGDGNIKSIVLKYPILALQEYIVKEFEIMKPDVKRQDLDDNWTDFFMVLDKMFEKDTEESDMEDNDSEIMKIIETLETKIKYKTSKKEMDLITKVKTTDVDLRSKKNSPPRAVVIIDEDGKINNTYIIGDEVEIDAGKSFKNMLQLLIMVYYVYDLSYPKCYQLLGFLQTFIFKDDTKFHKGANYLKFEKDFIRVKENSTDADL